MARPPTIGEKKGKEPAYCPARVLAGSKVIDCQIINMTNKGGRLSLDEEAEFTTPFVLDIGELGSLLAETSPGKGRRISVTLLDQESRVTKVLQAVTERYPDIDQRRKYPRVAVTYAAKAYSGDTTAECRIRDLSQGGAALGFDHEPSLNNVFRLKTRRFGEFRCRKMWQDSQIMGITFMESPKKFDDYVIGPSFHSL